MSFRPPRARKPRRQGSSSPAVASGSASRSASPSKAPSAHQHLVLPSMVPKQRRPRNSQGMFISRPDISVAVPGQDYTQMPFPDRGRKGRAATSANAVSGSTAYSYPEDATNDPPAFDIDDVFIEPQMESQNEDQRLKRQTQWGRWMNEVIPSLLRPHLSLLRKSASLRSISRSESFNCTCGKTGARHLKVVCVHFEGMFSFLAGSQYRWPEFELEKSFISLMLCG